MKYLLLVSAALLPAWSAASAQDQQDIRVRVGIGAQLQPEFVGGDGHELAPLWRINIARGTHEFAASAPGYSFGIPVVSTNGFSFGPAANIAGGRKDSDV